MKPDWERELEFSEDELAEMGAELRRPGGTLPPGAAPKRKKKSTMRVPVDIVPRRDGSATPTPRPSPAAVAKEDPRTSAPTASDLLVERALAAVAANAGGGVERVVSSDLSIPSPDRAGMGGGTDSDFDVEMSFEDTDPQLPVAISAASAAASQGDAVQRIQVPSDAAEADEADEATEELDAAELEEEAAESKQPQAIPSAPSAAMDGPVPAATIDAGRPQVTAPLPVDLPFVARPGGTTVTSVTPRDPSMPAPPARESSGPLPVDLIVAALAAPRPSVSQERELYEEELSSEEIEVVSEGPAAGLRPPAPPPIPTVQGAATPHGPPTPPPPEAVAGALFLTPFPFAVEPPPASDLSAAAPAPPSAEPVASRPRRRRRAKSWFEEVFDEDYLRTLPFMTARQTHREADFIEESLELDKSAQLLDIGCGYGRHALELAARGYQVVGIDLSLPLLIRAADEAQRRGLNVNFVHGDMRELAFEEQFDGIYCVFTTFGYFDDETNRKVAQGISRALKPRGRFVIEIVNRDYIINDLPTRVWWEGEGCVVLEEVDFNYYTSRLVTHRSIVFEDGRQTEQEISIRAYSLHELGKVLHHAGFRVTEVSGSLSTRGRFFGATSRSLLVVAEKR